MFFTTRAPTLAELQNCVHIDVASENNWNPTEAQLSQMRSILGTNVAPAAAPAAEPSMELMKSSDCPEARPMASLQKANPQAAQSECDDTSEDLPTRQTCSSRDRHSKTSAEVLSHRFGTSPDRAGATLDATRQKGTRSRILPLSRRHGADQQTMFGQTTGCLLCHRHPLF